MHPVKDLKVYQKAFRLSILVYQVTRAFPKEELFTFIFILNNLEGKGRYSDKDYARFLSMARGSLFGATRFSLP